MTAESERTGQTGKSSFAVEKVRHVLTAKNTDRNHHCHWPGCDRQVKPAMFMCKMHWFSLPGPIRKAIWVEYRPGQEQDKRPSERYLSVVKDAMDWIAKQEGR